MKKKVLLNHVCVLLLSSLSVPSLALGSIDDLKADINDPTYNYPEHNHSENQITSLMNNIHSTINPNMGELRKIPLLVSSISENHPPLISSTTPISFNPIKPKLEPEDTYPIYPGSHEDYSTDQNSDLSSWSDKFDGLNDDIQTANHSVKTIQSSLLKLEQSLKDSEYRSQKYTDKEIFASEELAKSYSEKIEKKYQEEKNKINQAITNLNKEIKDSDKLTSLLINDAEKNSKAHADLILSDQQKINIDRFDKLDKQNYLYARQFKQINAKFDHLESKISQTARDANAGIAAVAAMTNIPYTSGTRFSAGLGMGNFKNGKAIAAGAQYQVKQNLNLRSSISWNNSDSAVIGAGVAYGW